MIRTFGYTRRTRLMGGAAIACLTLGVAMPAHAAPGEAPVSLQDAGAPAAQAEEEPAIVVTGSRIARDGFDASTPVAVVTSEEVQLTGTTNVEALLQDEPQFVPSTNGGASGNTVPGGTADVNLRGFGATRNLVLVNGRRFAIYGPEQVTDINTIPAALIERTEVVTGGSSAVYGSDAITGVVNFVMKSDFEGVEARGQFNIDSATWTKGYSLDVTVGGNFADGRGNTVVSANYLKRGGITRGERGDWAFDSLSDGCIKPGTGGPDRAGQVFGSQSGAACTAAGGELGFITGGSGDIPNGRFSGIPLPGSAQSNAGLNAAYAAAGLGAMGSFGFTFNDAGATARPALDPADRFNLGPDNYLILPQERWMINSFSHYDFSDAITGYLELHYSNNRVDAQLAPSNVGVNTLFDVNNPYLSASMQEVLRQLDMRETGTTTIAAGSASYTTTANDGRAFLTAGKRYNEVGPRRADMRRNVYRAAIGFRGDLGDAGEGFLTDLKYDVYYSYARTEETTLLQNAISRSRLQASLLRQGGAAPVCNIFGQNISDACANAIRISATNSTQAELQVLAGNFSGNLFSLPAGPVGFSLGGEWRKSKAVFNPDSFLSSGDVAGFNPGLPTSGQVSAKEIYGEVRVPVLADTPFFHALTLNGAFRYSDYSLGGIGGVWTYLGGAEWSPTPDVTFRGQFQHAIRAPNVGELFGGSQRIVGPATDPCGPFQPAAQQTTAVRNVCVANGVPNALVWTAGVQPNTIIPYDAGGNPNVGAERSDTWTLGAVFTPGFIPRLRASVDYFNIRLDGAVSQLGGGLANTLNLCFNVIQDNSSEFCQAIRRDPNTGAINDPYVAQIRNANTGALETSGIDFAVRYSMPLGFGLFAEESKLNLSTSWTYTDEFTITPVQAFPNIKNYCIGSFGSTCGEPLPKWRGNTRVTWDTGDLTLSLRHRYIGKVTNDRYVLPLRAGSASVPALNTLVYPVLPAQHYFDLSFTYDAMDKLQFFGGVNNLFANEPPLVGSPQIRANTYPATYDVLRQEFFIGAVLKF
ncbi:TonB-dependent receptor plug domain-containing protein [Sphingomonas canadensis]|uniref:TonB-dependent receptor plug domain-containing protein n=1 Tax=Sphingomonas canadensis TaxID=1219257 RepID=A0ABW3H968_9SPHN|nr:TonB-dependent receptor [Sphingomonas canadensis]MCW3837721.1 TonB-dependent receptor [Sphingomonas canadensis]